MEEKEEEEGDRLDAGPGVYNSFVLLLSFITHFFSHAMKAQNGPRKDERLMRTVVTYFKLPVGGESCLLTTCLSG